MSVISVRLSDDVRNALKDYCDRINSNPNAEIVLAVRKHIGMPTFEEKLEWLEEQVNEIRDRLKILETTNAIAIPQSAQPDIASSQDD